MTELTDKQRWFFQEYAHDLNPLRAAKKVGLSRREYEMLTNDDAYREFVREALAAYAKANDPNAEPDKPRPSDTKIEPGDVTRESINREIIQVMEDLNTEAISPGQATAKINAIKALAQVNGLIATEVVVSDKRNVRELTTAELLAKLNEKDTKLIDVTPQPASKDG